MKSFETTQSSQLVWKCVPQGRRGCKDRLDQSRTQVKIVKGSCSYFVIITVYFIVFYFFADGRFFVFCRNLSLFAIFRKSRSDGPLTLSFFGVAGDFWRRLLLQIEYYMCLRVARVGLVQFIKIFAIYLFPELVCLLHSCLSYRKIPKISPGAHIFQRPF